ncbi:MAG: exodeoxyribonuclease V subunit gamma [Phycisphaerae bacterium]|nr:exodeoxyribonuclease V subunit gamma [Phycisphaerae bacterium]
MAEKLDDTNRAEEFLKALFALFDDFPASAHRRTFVERLRGLLVGLKFEAGAGGAGTHGKRDRVEDELLLRRDVLSLESFNGVLRDICETEDAGGEVKLDVFRRELVSALSAVRIPAYEPAGAPVVVFDVQHCRALSFEHVFLMGLSEHGFPNIRREHPFYDEQAREELRDGGVRLQRMVETEEQEMLLFYLAVTRARTSLTLSYPSADARGRQVLPSQYLDELEALFSPADESGHGIERQSVGLGDLDLSIEHARSVREARSWLFCNYWAAGKTRQPGLSEHLLHHFCESDPPTRAALAGLAAERERERGKVFGPFDGMLADEGIIERLQRQYPGERPMSASQFETFGQCSWKFFARYILRLESLEEPTEELGPMDVGQIYHALLRRFFTALRASSVGTKITAGNRDAALKILDAEAEAYFGHLQRTGRIGSPTLWKVQRRQAIEDLQALVDWEMENPGKFGEGLAPAYFEAEFGQERQFRDTEISTVEPLIFKTLWGPLRLRGRIDRVDVARRDGEVEALAVIDYKTGQAPKKKWMLEGISFQLPVYLRAATELLMPGVRDAQASAAFFSIRGCGPRNAIKRFDSKGEESDYYLNVMKSAEEYIRRWVAGIREGAFPVFPRTDCGRCEFDDACRYFRWRIDAKEQPEGLGKIVWDESEDA